MKNAKDFMIEWYAQHGEYSTEEEYLNYLDTLTKDHNESTMVGSDTRPDGQGHGADPL